MASSPRTRYGRPADVQAGESPTTADLIRAVFEDTPSPGLPDAPGGQVVSPPPRTRLGAFAATVAGKIVLAATAAAAGVAGVAVTTGPLDSAPPEPPAPIVVLTAPASTDPSPTSTATSTTTPGGSTTTTVSVEEPRPEPDVAAESTDVVDSSETAEPGTAGEGCGHGQATADVNRNGDGPPLDPCTRAGEQGPAAPPPASGDPSGPSGPPEERPGNGGGGAAGGGSGERGAGTR